MDTPYNSAAIREFLRNRFDADELMSLCFDYFPEVYADFGVMQRKSQKIQMLLAYVRRNGRFPDLLATLARERPDAYKTDLADKVRHEKPATFYPYPPPRRNPQQVMIGHARQDGELAHRLANDLRNRGWQVWIAPDSVRAGEKWQEAIERGLRESGIFLLLLTKRSVNSGWVQLEASSAITLEQQEQVRFIPLLMEKCDVPLLWQAYQWIRFVGNYETGLQQLLATLAPRGRRSLIWPGDGKEMVRLQAGDFLFGRSRDLRTMPEFWIDKTAVTNAEYGRFLQATGHRPPDHWENGRVADSLLLHPVVNVSWYDAVAYVDWANKRLPTVQEWERAARGMGGRLYPWGNQRPHPALANYGFNVGRTTPVGLYSPPGDSPEGAVDMLGNVWEWTIDIDEEDDSHHLLCGGAFGTHAVHLDIAMRHANLPTLKSPNIGFRCAADLISFG